MNEVENKIRLIRKKYKNKNLFLELYLLDYEGFSIYIRIDYDKKLDVYKLNWYDLEAIQDKNIEKYMGSEYISRKDLERILKILENKENNYHEEQEKNIVALNVYENEGYHYQFTRFIPKELSFLSEIFITIFENLPKKLEEFLYELHGDLMETRTKYEYHDELEFDLFEGDLTEIFGEKIIERGKKYYKENKVKFLEKIDDKYYSIVSGTEKYLTVIKYDEKTKKMLVYCTCPCEFYCKHMYSVIKAIRKNEIRKFYKVLYINKKQNLLENTTNNKYILCSGLEEDYLEIINKYGEIELVPLLDEDNNLNFKVLEDDENKSLTKEINKIIR